MLNSSGSIEVVESLSTINDTRDSRLCQVFLDRAWKMATHPTISI